MTMEDISVRRTNFDMSVTVKKPDGKQTTFVCRDIRGALVWPTLNSPGYYCIFAQRNDPTPQGKLPLQLLGEASLELPKQIFQKLMQDAKRLGCYEFYNDYQDGNEELIRAFYEYSRYQQNSNIKFTKAPFSKSFHIGILLIKEWAKNNTLNIPNNTILRDQLKNIDTADLSDKPEEKFFAVNALRFIVATVEKADWHRGHVVISDPQREKERGDPGGWT